MRYLTYALVWLSLTQEVEGFIFDGHFSTWLTVVGSFLFKGLPVIHVMPWDALVMGALIASPLTAKNRVPEITKAIRVTFIGLALLWVWGVARSGSAYQTMFQIRAFVLQLFLAMLVIATCKTRAHVRGMGLVIVFAAVYRAFVLLWFYLEVAQHLPTQLNSLTDHADSVLFVSGLFVLVINAIERKRFASIFSALLMAALMITAMVLNNRRIAWLDCGIASACTYLLWPTGKTKTVMTRILVALSPALVAYVAIGWGSPTGIFKPVGSISTMFGEHQDPSSIMRDIENYNLLRTLKGNPLLGSGWGHEYVEEVVAYNISDIFPQYRYMPHNSLLGMVAFTGMIGFALIWQYLGVSIFMLARVCLLAKDPTLRVAGQSALIAMVTVIVQYWGDVGLNHLGVNTMLAVTVGLAGRLPALAGVWPAAKGARERALEPRHDVQDRENPQHAEPGKPLADPA